jgi:hypothetical protein
MGSGANYIQSYSKTHFGTDLEQLLTFFNYQKLDKEYLLDGLKNTINNGYELQKLKQNTATTKPYFENILFMVEYVEKGYDNEMFVIMLKNTINNGIDLI